MSVQPNELLQAKCDSEGLERLFSDLRGLATVKLVRVRGAERGRSHDEVGLSEASALLARGEARAVQIRYRYDGDEFIDTIWPEGSGYRVVRVRAPGGPEG